MCSPDWTLGAEPMQSGIRFDDVFVVQLVYFTRLNPGSEFRLYAPSDSWLSDGARSPGGLTWSLPRNTHIQLIKDIREWKPKAPPKSISLEPDSIAIARVVFWDIAGILGRAEGQSDGIPYDDSEQPSSPFWIIDSSANKVVSVSKSLDIARDEFEDRVKHLASALGRAT